MAQRWNHGWFDVHPRYSCGSPAMVDMATALSVAKDEARMINADLEGAYGPEATEYAKARGLGGIVEWKQEAGRGVSIVAYDLLTRKWYIYHPTDKDLHGEYEACGNHMKAAGALHIKVTHMYGGQGRGTRGMYSVVRMDDYSLPLLWAVPANEVRDFLNAGRYRKEVPGQVTSERGGFYNAVSADIARKIDEALEDAGVTCG